MRKNWEQLLARMLRLLVLAAIGMTALVYPFRLSESVLGRLEEWAHSAGWLGTIYLQQLRSQLAFTHSPLIYKECVAEALLLATLCTLVALKLVRVLGGRAVGPKRVFPLGRAVIWVALLLGYLGLSAIAWSPTFHYSLRTFVAFALGVVMLFSVFEIGADRRLIGAFMVLIGVCGAIIAGIAVLQHVELAPRWFMPDWGPEGYRNRMGSLIGHNTGVSSWLLFPLSFAIYWVLWAKRGAGRIAGGFLASLILFVLIAAQSRAIWLICVLLLPGYTWYLLRCSGRRVKTTFWLVVVAAVLGIVALQTVAPSVNPFARHMMSLGARLREHVLNPQQLLHETRLRVLAASMSLVAEKPLQGHGLGSFQYVYPPAQGQYFVSNPDSVLALTQKRTDLAHNDYLQFLVETGIIGVLLAGAPLLLLVMRGWRGFRALERPHDRALMVCLALPVVGVGLHAWIDFPMHIVPIALAVVVCIAFWASGLRVPEGLPAEDAAPADGGGTSRLRWGRVVLAVAAVASLVWTPLAYQFVAREFVSDIYYADANSWLATARGVPDIMWQRQGQAFFEAREGFKKAIRINLFNGQAYEGLAFAHAGLGRIEYRLWKETGKADHRVGSQKNYEMAINMLTQGTKAGELRWHFTYYLIGESYHMLWRLNPEVVNYIDSAKRALGMALGTNPADVQSLFELQQILEEQPKPDVHQADVIRRRMIDVDPEFVYRTLLAPIQEAADLGKFENAEKGLAKLERSGSADWRLKAARAHLHIRRANWPPPELERDTTSAERIRWRNEQLARAARALSGIGNEAGADPRPEYLALRLSALKGDLESALQQADHLYTKYPADKDLAVFRVAIADQLGKKSGREPWPGFENEPYVWARWLSAWLFHLNRIPEAAEGLVKLSDGGEIGIPETLRCSAYLKSAGRMDLYRELVANMKRRQGANPDIASLPAE